VGAERVELVWSLWSGYWNRDGCVMREWAEKRDAHVHFIHSGGHAWPEDLARLTDALAAKQTIVVHTEAQASGGP
jgi:mRNA degradation ribonuclease J1/J2